MQMPTCSDSPSRPRSLCAGEVTQAPRVRVRRGTPLPRLLRASLAAAIAATPVTIAHAQPATIPAVPASNYGRLGDTYGRFGDNAIREALRGVISPDGQSFAYEVVVAHNRNLWIRDLATGRDRELTNAPGARNDPAWSPDGAHIAETDNGWVVVIDAQSGIMDTVYGQPPARFVDLVASHIAWQSVSELTFDYSHLESPTTVQRWSVNIDGTNAHVLPRTTLDTLQGTPSPDGQRVAVVRRCCGGAAYGVWIISANGQRRCVAGPIGYAAGFVWSPTGDTLVMAAKSQWDTTSHIYTLSRAHGPATRVAGLTGTVYSLSANARGDIAIATVHDDPARADLWIGHVPLPTESRDTLERCPDLPSGVVAWVHDQRLPFGPRAIAEVARIRNHGVIVFRVAYGEAHDVYPTLLGIRYGERFGWLVAPPPASASSAGRALRRFTVKPSDRYLFSIAFDSALRDQSVDVAREWKDFLVNEPLTPVPVLARIARENQDITAGIASNLALAGPHTPINELLELAAAGPALAVVVMNAPPIARDANLLMTVGRRFAGNAAVDGALRKHLTDIRRQLAADPHATEPVLLQLELASGGWGDDSLDAQLLDNPVVRQSPRLLALIAAGGTVRLRQRAGALLTQRGLTPADALRTVLLASGSGELSCDDVFEIARNSPVVAGSMPLQSDILNGPGRRCPVLRQQLAATMASQRDTPLATLRAIAASQRSEPDRLVLDALIRNPAVRSDSAALTALRAVPIAPYNRVADSLLRAVH
jgi:hypothetical protein